MASKTIRPEMIAFVVAIAGIILPAMAVPTRKYKRMLDSGSRLQTFGVEATLLWNAEGVRPEVRGACYKIHCIHIVFIEGDRIHALEPLVQISSARSY